MRLGLPRKLPFGLLSSFSSPLRFCLAHTWVALPAFLDGAHLRCPWVTPPGFKAVGRSLDKPSALRRWLESASMHRDKNIKFWITNSPWHSRFTQKDHFFPSRGKKVLHVKRSDRLSTSPPSLKRPRPKCLLIHHLDIIAHIVVPATDCAFRVSLRLIKMGRTIHI